MIDKRAEADRIIVAQLSGKARHHAKWRDLTAAEEAEAITALSELADGRTDLLAEVAGLAEGFSEGQLDEPIVRQAAQLCRLAGADPAAVSGGRTLSARRFPPRGAGGPAGRAIPGSPVSY